MICDHCQVDMLMRGIAGAGAWEEQRVRQEKRAYELRCREQFFSGFLLPVTPLIYPATHRSCHLPARYLSGVPILEKQADERWGHLEEYQRYKAATPEFFPALPGKGHDA